MNYTRVTGRGYRNCYTTAHTRRRTPGGGLAQAAAVLDKGGGAQTLSASPPFRLDWALGRPGFVLPRLQPPGVLARFVSHCPLLSWGLGALLLSAWAYM